MTFLCRQGHGAHRCPLPAGHDGPHECSCSPPPPPRRITRADRTRALLDVLNRRGRRVRITPGQRRAILNRTGYRSSTTNEDHEP